MSEARVEQGREAHPVTCTVCRASRTWNTSAVCDSCETADRRSVWPPSPRRASDAASSPSGTSLTGHARPVDGPLDAGGMDGTSEVNRFTFELLRDAAVEAGGHSVLDEYVERFWLPVLGPSATLLLRHVARELVDQDVYVVDAETLAGSLGIGVRARKRGVALTQTIDRLAGRFGMAERSGPGAWRVRTHIGDLPRRYHRSIPRQLAVAHDRYLADRLRAAHGR